MVMSFPQYLWRIGCKRGGLRLRRGHTSDEPIEKSLRKDYTPIRFMPIGVLTYCDLSDRELYTSGHPWDWRNE